MGTPALGQPRYFATPEAFRAWLEEHHASAPELWVGFHKKRTGRPSITWPEAVDEALSFGWIDGIRRAVDETRYAIRFTPRRPGSTWSAVNIARVAVLDREGRLHASGRAAFERRRADTSGTYSYERARAALDDDSQREFERHAGAWAWFSTQPPSYRRAAVHWVISAKRDETRRRRLATLISDSAQHRRLGPLRR